MSISIEKNVYTLGKSAVLNVSYTAHDSQASTSSCVVWPTVYKFKDQLMTEQEALTLITERLKESSGDIMLDLDCIIAMDVLDDISYSTERRMSDRRKEI